MTLEGYRRDFESSTNKSISMPLAGAIVWLLVAMISTQVGERAGILILLFCSGAIFPVALLIARLRGETLVATSNPLAKLMGYCILMVNLLWAVHIPLFIYAPTFVPLSLGIGLGLHWVVYSWIVQHPVGIIHAILRTILVLAVWLLFPEQRLLAVGLVITFVYSVSIWQMLSMPRIKHMTISATASESGLTGIRKPAEVVSAWVDAFNRADAESLASLYGENAVNHQVAEAPVAGKAAIHAMFSAEFSRASMVCIVENIFEDGEWAILEWKDPLGLRGCGFFHIVNGSIIFQRGYWDKLSFLRMHGLPIPQQ